MTTTPGSARVPAFLARPVKGLLIDGEWRQVSTGERFESINPSTGATIAQLAEAAQSDVDDAVAAARRAFEGPWSGFTPAQRQNVMLRIAELIEANFDELRLLDTFDMGAPISRPAQAGPIVEILRYYAGWATKIHGETVPNSIPGSLFTYTRKEPVGVVASIIPWNGPIGQAVTKIAPVLATGCTMVLKPAEEASLSSLRLGELTREAGLPPGVINILTGSGESTGAALTRHPDVDKIAFTGSSVTGQAIVRAAAGNLKRLSLELGGKSPDIIFADADLDAAVVGAGMGVFRNSGQVCSAGTRIFVERPAYDEFVGRLSEFADSLRVGDSLDPRTQIGPIVSQAQLDRVVGYMEVGVSEGARLTAGGRRLTDGNLAHGYFVPPTVYADARDDMRIASEEIFGPVAAVMPFNSIDEVLARANHSQFGLAGGVWTSSLSKAHRVAHAMQAGIVWVNTYGPSDPAVPWGGARMSGWGNEMSMHSIDEYMNVKAVWINIGG